MKVYKYITLVAITLMAFACTEPVAPTATNMAYGKWSVAEYYVDGQSDGSNVISRFTLERDNSFLLENNFGVLSVGTWASTDTSLTLTGTDGSVLTFTIVFQSYSKMQLLQSIESPTVGTIEIRYLMNHNSADSY